MLYNESMLKFFSVIYRRAQMHLDRELKPYNIRAGQVPILRILDLEDGITQEKIRHLLHMDKGALAKTIRPLLTEGYITRIKKTEDRRAYKISLTKKGKKIMPGLSETISGWIAILTEGLSEEEAEICFNLLSKMSDNAFSHFDTTNSKEKNKAGNNMPPWVSGIKKVQEMYDETASDYSDMMDNEIKLPLYNETLTNLAEKIINIPGPVVDTSCGSGHMLYLYQKSYDPARSVIGIDISPKMIEITSKKLGNNAKVYISDMCRMDCLNSYSAAAVLSFFAIHHLSKKDIQTAFREWNRILISGGQLTLAAWEGSGSIDYGDAIDIQALRYTEAEITAIAEKTGFSIDQCHTRPFENFPMDAVYLEATKQ